MTLDAGKITNTAIILHDILSDQEKHVFIKNTDRVFRLAVHVLDIFLKKFESIYIGQHFTENCFTCFFFSFTGTNKLVRVSVPSVF